MKKRACAALALVMLLTLCACENGAEQPHEPTPSAPEITEPEPTALDSPAPETPPTPELSQRERDWLEDIEFLREEYKTKHIEPFYLCSEEEFDWKLNRLEAKVGELSDNDIFYEIMAIIAGMGDIHTYVYLDSDVALSDSLYGVGFPIWVQCFGDKLYLCGYLEDYEQFAPYLLREIVAVNGIDLTYLEKKAASVENPFNHWNSKEHLYRNFLIPSFLDWACCDYREGYMFQILNENQEVESIEVPVITSEAASGAAWILPENWEHLFCGRGGDWVGYVEGENGGCIHMHYTSLTTVLEIQEIFDATAAVIEEHPECGKLVIDLRNHPGGRVQRVALVQTCTKQLAALPIGQTYVITGGRTASGAVQCLAYFRDILDAVVIGEPTGQFASFFYMKKSSGQFVLPHSQISGRISNGWYETGAAVEEYYDENGRLYPWENTILPDVFVYQDIEDIRQGKDSVIQWVLEQ